MKKILLIPLLLYCLACNSTKEIKKTYSSQEPKITQKKTALKTNISQGKLIYTDFCIRCHLANGNGIPGNSPPLAGSDWLTEKRTESIHAVKFGQQGEIVVNGVPYNGIMSPMGLSDEEVADVLNYVMNSWGNTQQEIITPEEVASVKK